MSKDVLQVLEEAAALVKDKWIRCNEAIDDCGSVVSATSPRATNFCAVGAIKHAADAEDEYNNPLLVAALRALKLELAETTSTYEGYIESWNDGYCMSGEEMSKHMLNAAEMVKKRQHD